MTDYSTCFWPLTLPIAATGDPPHHLLIVCTLHSHLSAFSLQLRAPNHGTCNEYRLTPFPHSFLITYPTAIAAGMNLFIGKPFTIKDLETVLDEFPVRERKVDNKRADGPLPAPVGN